VKVVLIAVARKILIGLYGCYRAGAIVQSKVFGGTGSGIDRIKKTVSCFSCCWAKCLSPKRFRPQGAFWNQEEGAALRARRVGDEREREPLPLLGFPCQQILGLFLGFIQRIFGTGFACDCLFNRRLEDVKTQCFPIRNARLESGVTGLLHDQ
jgi:hypothetical protein